MTDISNDLKAPLPAEVAVAMEDKGREGECYWSVQATRSPPPPSCVVYQCKSGEHEICSIPSQRNLVILVESCGDCDAYQEFWSAERQRVENLIASQLEIWIRLYLYCKTGLMAYFGFVAVKLLMDHPHLGPQSLSDTAEIQITSFQILVILAACLTFMLTALTVIAATLKKVSLGIYLMNTCAWVPHIIISILSRAGMPTADYDTTVFYHAVQGTNIIWTVDFFFVFVVSVIYYRLYAKYMSAGIKFA